jgi:DNA mismatch repair protein MutL
VEIDPSLADFNIHPAKREVRFRDPGAIHHAISGGVKNFFHNYFLRTSRKETPTEEDATQIDGEFNFSNKNFEKNRSPNGQEKISNNNFVSFVPRTEGTMCLCENSSRDNSPSRITDNFIAESLHRRENSFANDSASIVYGDMRYIGRVFGLFILIEWGEKLYIIDQHAAHERILYNRFLEEPIPKQELLSPIPFTTQSDEEDAFLETKKEELSRLGVDIAKDGDGWNIEALPSGWKMGDAETVKEILELSAAGEDMAEQWAATVCCRAAIKDGDYPDDETAFSLGREALELPEPRCPHGRPIWTEISKKALFRAVRRE